tara:strand:+ start:3252 stop:3452 length:201 start_codon:yes stop_codon:yes gene_type:complete
MFDYTKAIFGLVILKDENSSTEFLELPGNIEFDHTGNWIRLTISNSEKKESVQLIPRNSIEFIKVN